MDFKRTFAAAVVISGEGLATMQGAFADDPDIIAGLINANTHFQNAAMDVVHEPIDNPLPEGLYIDNDDFIFDVINAAEAEAQAPKINFLPTVSTPALSGYLDYIQDGQRGEFDVSASLDLPREAQRDVRVIVSYAQYEQLLNDVNDRINAEPYVTDQDNFGKADVWSVFGNDCEDKGLKKRDELIAAGFPKEAIRIAVGVMPEGGHAVIAIDTFDRGTVFLDNYNPEIVSYDPNATTGFRPIGASSVENFMRLGAINPVQNVDPVITGAIAENERMYAPIDDTAPRGPEMPPLPIPRPNR